MSRATRAVALLWRDWKRGEGWFVEVASVAAFLVAGTAALFLIAYLIGALIGMVHTLYGVPPVIAGFAFLASAAIGWVIAWCLFDVARAIRSAWERAGREG